MRTRMPASRSVGMRAAVLCETVGSEHQCWRGQKASKHSPSPLNWNAWLICMLHDSNVRSEGAPSSALTSGLRSDCISEENVRTGEEERSTC